MTGRTLIEVKARCALILDDEEVIKLVKATNSPAAAFQVVFATLKDEAKSKAARWLAIMRRDYPTTYRQLIEQR